MRWDWEAIRAGATVALVFAVPLSIAARWAADSRDDPALAVWLNLGAVVGFVLGAGCAAWVQRVGTPLSHGLVTAVGTYLVAQAVFVAIRLVRGLDVRWFAVFFNLTAVLAAGLVGGLLGQRLRAVAAVAHPKRSTMRDPRRSTSARPRPRAAVVDERLRRSPRWPRGRSRRRRRSPGSSSSTRRRWRASCSDAATEVIDTVDEPITAVGITNQRASTIVWDRATGEPIAPALGWQDLRTVGECITAKAEHDLALAPNQSATKLAWLLDHVDGARDRDLCFGTVDTWLAWSLAGGAAARHRPHQRRRHRLAGRRRIGVERPTVLDVLGIPDDVLPALVDSSGVIAEARRVARSAADRRAGRRPTELAGRPGLRRRRAGPRSRSAPAGCSTSARAPTRRPSARRGEHGTFPIVAWSHRGSLTWGAEAIMLSAGSNVEWLRDDLGLIATERRQPRRRRGRRRHRRRHLRAGAARARHAAVGLRRPGHARRHHPRHDRAHLVRAVLEGVAHRGADLVEAAEADTGLAIGALRVDGGMSANPTFVQALADAAGRPVEVSPVVEATTLGAAFLAGLATGVWDDMGDADRAFTPARVVEPGRAARSPGVGEGRRARRRLDPRAVGARFLA